MNTENKKYLDSFGVEYTPKDIRKFIVKKKKSWQIFIEYKHTIQ